MLGRGGLCWGWWSPSLVSVPVPFSAGLWSEHPPMLGCRAGAVQRPGGAGLTRLGIARGRKVPFPFACPHPAAGSCLGCTCLAPGGRGRCSSNALGRDNSGGWGGGCAAVQLWERSWVSPWPGSASASLWVRKFGNSSTFSRDAHGRRVHLAVCNFIGLWMGHLPVSVTPG